VQLWGLFWAARDADAAAAAPAIAVAAGYSPDCLLKLEAAADKVVVMVANSPQQHNYATQMHGCAAFWLRDTAS
jgi:hypothetical protein